MSYLTRGERDEDVFSCYFFAKTICAMPVGSSSILERKNIMMAFEYAVESLRKFVPYGWGSMWVCMFVTARAITLMACPAEMHQRYYPGHHPARLSCSERSERKNAKKWAAALFFLESRWFPGAKRALANDIHLWSCYAHLAASNHPLFN